MSSKSETGHEKNVGNFEQLLTFCAKFGASYAPTNPALTMDALNAQLAEAKAVLAALVKARTEYDNAVNNRKDVFTPVKTDVTKIFNALKVCGARDNTIADAQGFVNKIIGRRSAASAKAIAKRAKMATTSDGSTTDAPKTISTSQQSYDMQVKHYSALLSCLAEESKYAPNEKQLQIESLTTVLNQMQAANTAVAGAVASMSLARIERDRVFDEPKTGLVDTSSAVKAYVKSVYGARSGMYREVSALPFKKLS